jgi:2-keto-4-pentenoate hydratase
VNVETLNRDQMRAAEWIAEHRISGTSLADMPAELKPAAETAAYHIQAAVLDRLTAAGYGSLVGWKVGVTTPQMRVAMGFDTPIGGGMLAGGRTENGATIRCADYLRIGVECEMAFVLGAPLGGGSVPVDVAVAGAAVASLHPAIELIDDRYGVTYRDFGVPTIIADSAFHAGFVLGPAVPDWQRLDLGALRGVTRANGVVMSTGYGRDVQGHPLASLAWMANRLTTLGRRLEPGQIVSTGSLPVHHWCSPGETVETEIEHVGLLRLNMV